jgi:hypothetical protein
VRTTREHAARLLGVDVDASAEQVNHAWRVWAKLAHPDAGGDREHFEALARARSMLVTNPARPVAQPAAPAASAAPQPRAPLRDVCCRPSARGIVVLALVAVGSVITALLAPHLSDFGTALAVGVVASTSAIAIQRTLLGRSADTGHRITVLTLAWFPIAAALTASVASQGVAIIGFLPVIALPFVATVGLVNPGAGLWRPIRLPS